MNGPLTRNSGMEMCLKTESVEELVASLPSIIRRPIERAILNLKLKREFRADRLEYGRYCGAQYEDLKDIGVLERDLTLAYHGVEKALTLPMPRRPFGKKLGVYLYSASKSPEFELIDASIQESALSALSALNLWNESSLISESSASRDEMLRVSPFLPSFFSSRRSCRNFDFKRQIPEALITESVTLAQESPSVCNRQASRVKIFRDPDRIAKILDLQNGNAGFGHNIPMLAIVSSDRRYFRNPGERKQRWIDGALFAMTLVWALHGCGLSSCMLNWSMGHKATQTLRERAELDAHLDVVCLIAIGYAAEPHLAARSRRRTLATTLTWDSSPGVGSDSAIAGREELRNRARCATE